MRAPGQFVPKTNLQSGDIFQIPLPANLGFAYAKFVNLLELDPNARYPVLIRVFNYRSLDQQERDIENIVKCDLILSPLLIAGIEPTLSKKIWKVVGNFPLTEEEKLIPNYKKADPDEENPIEWYYLTNADVSKKMRSKFENVKHLESIGAVRSLLVATKIAMALLKDEGKRVEEYFKLEEYFEKVFYKQVMQIPAYYKQPAFMRGKVTNKTSCYGKGNKRIGQCVFGCRA